MSDFIQNKDGFHFSEHYNWPDGEDISSSFNELPKSIAFKGIPDRWCIEFKTNKTLHTSYYVGLDWISEDKKLAIYVEPKLNKYSTKQTNYVKMLFAALKHRDVAIHAIDLFEIKWDSPHIKITQNNDLLTPFLVVQYLKIVQDIVRKGLKKSHYKTKKNLYGKIKGKVLVAATIKQNLIKSKNLHTYCSYDEFGINGLENRLIKKALIFVNKYITTAPNLKSEAYLSNVFNYINPAFEEVSEEVSIEEVKYVKTNIFYKEYEEGIKLAKLILKKFGYNINNVSEHNEIMTPPFWIDMSKLFELYVLGKLKDKYGSQILYGRKEANGKYGLPDYLLIKENEKMVIDAKYKPIYQKDRYDITNIRQLSGYARDTEILDKLGYKTVIGKNNAVIKCLLIYPDQNTKEELWENKESEIEDFQEFYKRPIALPTIKT